MISQETLLYMLLQSDWCRPPSSAAAAQPDWASIAAEAHEGAVDNDWFEIPKQTFTVGLHDPDNGDGPSRYFGWDVEKPAREVTASSLKAKGRPITNAEYARFMMATGNEQLPASWRKVEREAAVNSHMNGDSDLHDFVQGKAVRTMYGPVPLKYALDWPVSASYDELSRCAQHMGGRIPTMEEVKSIYHFAETLKKKEAANALGQTIPAVNGHLSNEGVEETPPSKPSVDGSSAAAGLNPNEVFVNLDEANVGFKHWHPMPVTQNGGKLAGQGDMGGLWEWTSSALVEQEGFEPMKLYPAYSGKSDNYQIVIFAVLTGSSRLLRYEAQRGAWRVMGYSSEVGWPQVLVSTLRTRARRTYPLTRL